MALRLRGFKSGPGEDRQFVPGCRVGVGRIPDRHKELSEDRRRQSAVPAPHRSLAGAGL